MVGNNSQIPVGTTYFFTKADAAEGYTTTIDGVEQASSGTKTMVAVGDSDYDTNNETTINSYLNSEVDTNAFMGIAIYILLILAGTAGVAYFVRKKIAKKA